MLWLNEIFRKVCSGRPNKRKIRLFRFMPVVKAEKGRVLQLRSLFRCEASVLMFSISALLVRVHKIFTKTPSVVINRGNITGSPNKSYETPLKKA